MATLARWDDAKRLFDTALTLEASEREAYVRAACAGDSWLLAEVRSLLDWHPDSSGFLETPAARVTDLALVAASSAEMIGRSLGSWRIVGVIGQGGMGVVYRAERADAAFKRQAAIKVIRPGPDLTTIVERFRLERETLAALDHPNIARLLDGGTTEDGHSYFVMELVDGIPVDRYCDEQAHTVDQRLDLFRQVCAGVQYAHEHLVVHRDIKPDNILVAQDGTPKLLDFGVSKILSHEPGHTPDAPAVAATYLMTPDYASPEQVGGRQSTTATDVYSLGVLLHVLLTGTRPYHLSGTTAATIQEQLSAAVLTSPSVRALAGEDAAERARRRGTTSQKLAKRLAGDLDAIMLRVLGRTPATRYSRVEQLVGDLECHRTSHPVSVRSQDRSYVIGAAMKRHRVMLGLAAGVALLTLTGVAGVLWEASIAAEERGRAERRFNDVRQLAGAFMYEVHDAIVEVPGTTAARELIVRTTLLYLENLAREAAGDLGLQRELASAFVRVGDVEGNPTNPNLGDTEGALGHYRRAIAIADGVRAASTRDPEATRTLALAHRRLGDVLALTGDKASAFVEFRRSQALYGEVAAGDAPTLSDRIEVGIADVKLGDVLGNPNFQNLGRAADAERQYAVALSVFRALDAVPSTDFRVRRFLGLTLERIGTMHEAAGRWPAAAGAYGESFSIRRVLAAEQPRHQNIQRDLAIAYEKLGNVRHETDGPLAAAAEYRHSLAQFERMAASDPSDENAARTVAISREKLARTLMEIESHAEGIELFRRALAAHRNVVRRDPQNALAKCDAARVAESLGDALATQASTASAGRCEQWRAGLDLLRAPQAGGQPACTAESSVERLIAKLRSC